jgi:hypothetical protein
MVLTKLVYLEQFYNLLKLDPSNNCYNNIVTFVSNPIESNFNKMTTSLNNFVYYYYTTQSPNFTSIRVLVSDSDGTVAYDSNNYIGKNITNTYSNYTDKVINENHNSRAAIMTALISNAGVGTEQKWSTSTNNFTQYLAVRIGINSETSYGVIRVSMSSA